MTKASVDNHLEDALNEFEVIDVPTNGSVHGSRHRAAWEALIAAHRTGQGISMASPSASVMTALRARASHSGFKLRSSRNADGQSHALWLEATPTHV